KLWINILSGRPVRAGVQGREIFICRVDRGSLRIKETGIVSCPRRYIQLAIGFFDHEKGPGIKLMISRYRKNSGAAYGIILELPVYANGGFIVVSPIKVVFKIIRVRMQVQI